MMLHLKFSVLKMTILKYILAGIVQNSQSARAASTIVAGEPSSPIVKTDIPGPKSKQLLEELNSLQV